MDTAIIASLIGVVGVLFGVLLGYRLSKNIALDTTAIAYKQSIDLMRRQEFNRAVAAIRSAFVEATLFLEFDIVADITPVDNLHVNDILNKFVAEQLKAIIAFKPFLSEHERVGIETAWDEYCHPNGTPEDKYEKRDFILNDYYHIEESSGLEAAKRTALEKINSILKFAAFK